jgi:hypothetical protein
VRRCASQKRAATKPPKQSKSHLRNSLGELEEVVKFGYLLDPRRVGSEELHQPSQILLQLVVPELAALLFGGTSAETS